MDYNEILSRFDVVGEAYVLVNVFEVYIGYQKIKIKILRDLRNGTYSYSNSHHYHGQTQVGPYMSSRCVMMETETEALNGAIDELTAFYNPTDSNARWIEAEEF